MTRIQQTIFANHLDMAELLTLKDGPVFWIASLEDPIGFEIAVRFRYSHAMKQKGLNANAPFDEQEEQEHRAHLVTYRDECLGRQEHPTMYGCLGLEKTNELLSACYKRPPLAPSRYVVVVADGHTTVVDLNSKR
jgi:hypothetical protein